MALNYAKQSEILFMWDCENSNPNGDMLENNAPRYDNVSRRALVSDVRIKRTIRDYTAVKKEGVFGYEIFIANRKTQEGYIATGKQNMEILGIAGDEGLRTDAIKQRFFDSRVFGGVFTGGKKSESKKKRSKKNIDQEDENEQQDNTDDANVSFNLTGAAQFKMTKSAHEVDSPRFIKGTGAFASGENKDNKTFREEYILPYALFSTYGVINNANAEISGMTEEDVPVLIDGLWNGLLNNSTRSKMGITPRFLLKITYKDKGFFAGDIDNYIKIKPIGNKTEIELRSIDEYNVDISKLLKLVERYDEKIEKIEYILDDRFAESIIDIADLTNNPKAVKMVL